MELREHYDPEDIESLLQERGFDELLEEERAYVLRHLTGREEYETMRALLNQVRDDGRTRDLISVDDGVRTNVLAAFRAGQQPQWRIWLNCIGTLLWPKEVSAMWRPALAMASLAVLIFAGIHVVRTMDGTLDHAQVSQVKNEEAPERDLRKETTPPTGIPEEPDGTSAQTIMPAQAASASDPREENSSADMAGARAQQTVVMDAELAEEAEIAKDSERTDAITSTFGQVNEVVVLDEKKANAEMADAAISGSTAKRAEREAASHEVTKEELSRNQSLANTSPSAAAKARTKTDRSIAASRSLGDDPAVLALISKGW